MKYASPSDARAAMKIVEDTSAVTRTEMPAPSRTGPRSSNGLRNSPRTPVPYSRNKSMVAGMAHAMMSDACSGRLPAMCWIKPNWPAPIPRKKTAPMQSIRSNIPRNLTVFIFFPPRALHSGVGSIHVYNTLLYDILSSAPCAAICSASCLLGPSPRAISLSPKNTPMVNRLSWSGPSSASVLYVGVIPFFS